MSFRVWLVAFTAVGLAAQPQPDLREAARLDQAGRCEEAGRIYEQALAQGKPGPSLWNNAGNHYLACGQPEKARHYFEQVVRAEPSHLNANVQLARLALHRGEFSQAENALGKLAVAHPGEFDVLFLLGRAAARAGHFSRARETLEAALRVRPDDLGATVECGLANAASGDYPRAVFLLARAQSHAPKQSAIALALARASEDAGYYGDAVLAYDRYLALRPDDKAARRDRARVLALTTDRSAEGARSLAYYVAGNPADALGHFYLAQVRWKEDTDSALASLAEAVRIDPHLTAAHVARAWLLHRVGRDAEALKHLETALRRSPDDVRALDQLGIVYLSLDRAADAERMLRRAAELAPRDAEVALHLGRALVDSGKEDEGQRWLDRWDELRPRRQRDPRRQSGMIELALLDPAGRRAREIERFRAMAKARPDDPLLQLHLAGLLLSDGQTEEARREYRTLSALNGDERIWLQAGRDLLAAREYVAARPFLERAGAHVPLAEVLLATAGPSAALAELERVSLPERGAEYAILRARTLDAAGRKEESEQCLNQALAAGPLTPSLARQAASVLAARTRYRESLNVLRQAISAAPADAELKLTEAVVLALDADTRTAGERLRAIQLRWPEWDRPWLVQGLMLAGMRRTAEAESKFRAAKALGARENMETCRSLEAWFFDRCAK